MTQLTGQTDAPPPERPLLAKVAVGLLAATALMSVVSAVSFLFAKTLVGCAVAVGQRYPSAPKGVSSGQFAILRQQALNSCLSGRSPTPATGAEVTRALQGQLLPSVVFAVIFAVLAFLLYRNKAFVRWAVVVLWALSLLGRTSLGPVYAYSALVTPGLPVSFRLSTVVGAVAFLGAAIILNLRPVTRYLNAFRPVRTAQNRPAETLPAQDRSTQPSAGLRGFFGPRPQSGQPGAFTGSGSAATSRPGRVTGKRKGRPNGSPSAPARHEGAIDPAAGQSAGRPVRGGRGKSRRS